MKRFDDETITITFRKPEHVTTKTGACLVKD